MNTISKFFLLFTVFLILALSSFGDTHFRFRDCNLPPDFDGNSDLVTLDIDNNGFPDIVASNYDTPMRVYMNTGDDINGDGGFEFYFDDSRIEIDTTSVHGLGLFDADGDSLLDIVLAMQKSWGLGGMENIVLIQEAGGYFEENSSAIPRLRDRTNGIVAADLNGDDLNDLVVANGSYYDSTVYKDRSYILINSGYKNADSLWIFYDPFDSAVFIDSVWEDSACTREVIVADFDTNGYPDILFVNRVESCRLLMNRCHGIGCVPRFEEADSSALPDTLLGNYHYYCGDHADIDLDGDEDFLISTYDQMPLLFINDSTGRFSQRDFPTFPHWGFRRKAIFEDFNDDSLPDVVIADQIIRYFMNDPSDTASFVDLTESHFPNNNMENQYTVFAMIAFDADIDGDMDIFAGNSWEQNRLYSNNHGSFRDITFSRYPHDASDDYQIYPFDIDDDSDLDIFYGGRDDSLHFYENVGDSFVSASSRIVGQEWATEGSDRVRVRSWAFGDLSGDGLCDFVLGGSDPNNPVIENHIHINRGDGTYADSTRLNIPWLTDISAKDIFLINANGDNRPDLFIVGIDSNKKDALYLNRGDIDGDGVDNFVNIPGAIPATSIGISGYSDFADINGDSLDDIIIAKTDSFLLDFTLGWHNVLLLSNGDSTYFDATDSLIPASTNGNAITSAARFGDVNGDGYKDIIFVNGYITDDPPPDSSSQSALLIYNPDSGRFIDATDSLPRDAFFSKPDARFADVDSDGDLDIIIGAVFVHSRYDRFNRHPMVYINNGTGGFGDSTEAWVPDIGSLMEHHNAIGVGDLDSDGRIDFLSQCDGQSRIWWNHYTDVVRAGETRHYLQTSQSLSAYPNPFNSSVTISIDAPVGAIHVLPLQIEIFDIAGRHIKTLRPSATSGTGPSGLEKGGMEVPLLKGDLGGSFTWTPNESIASGIYLVRARFDTRSLSGAETSTIKRIVYLK